MWIYLVFLFWLLIMLRATGIVGSVMLTLVVLAAFHLDGFQTAFVVFVSLLFMGMGIATDKPRLGFIFGIGFLIYGLCILEDSPVRNMIDRANGVRIPVNHAPAYPSWCASNGGWSRMLQEDLANDIYVGGPREKNHWMTTRWLNIHIDDPKMQKWVHQYGREGLYTEAAKNDVFNKR